MTRHAQPRGERRDWYRIQNAATADKPAEVFIYDEIDSFWGLSAEQFVKDLAAIDSNEIMVRINSPGGNVFDGVAILNALRGHDATITTVVEGVAASAASFIAMAGDTIVMRPNAEMMVHSAHGIVVGEASDMRSMADNLDRTNSNIAGIYADRAGGSVDDWLAVMAAETWYSDQEAVDAGLADRIESPASADTAAKARFDLSIYNYAGRRAAPAPRIAARTHSPSAVRAEVTTGEEGIMPTLIEGLRKRLGLADDVDEDTALQALDEALSEQAENPPDPAGEPAPVAEVAPIAAKLPDGVVAIDAAQLDALRAAAALGVEAHERQEVETRRNTVDEAVRLGKIPPARRAHWEAQLKADPGAAQVLASMAAGLVPVTEMGHSTSPEATSSDDDLFTSLFGTEAK